MRCDGRDKTKKLQSFISIVVSSKNKIENKTILNGYSDFEESFEESIDTFDKWSKIHINTKEWNGLDKFGNAQDTTIWKDNQQSRFMHYSCYITLLSFQICEHAIIRDAKATKAAKVMPTSRSQSPVHSDLLPTSPLHKKTVVN